MNMYCIKSKYRRLYANQVAPDLFLQSSCATGENISPPLIFQLCFNARKHISSLILNKYNT